MITYDKEKIIAMVLTAAIMAFGCMPVFALTVGYKSGTAQTTTSGIGQYRNDIHYSIICDSTNGQVPYYKSRMEASNTGGGSLAGFSVSHTVRMNNGDYYRDSSTTPKYFGAGMVAFEVKDSMPSPNSVNTIEAQFTYKSTFYDTWSGSLVKVGFTGNR